MRQKLAIGAAFGALALGAWGFHFSDARVTARILAASDTILATSVHQPTAEVANRSLTLRGFVDSADERAALLSALEAVPMVQAVIDETETVPARVPFVTEARKGADGMIRLSGAAPSAAARAALGALGAQDNADLEIASGAPGAWSEAMAAGLRAVAVLETGSARLTDNTLTLTGAALDPARRDQMRAALGPLPENITLDAQGVTLVDDGTPPKFTVRLSEDGSARATGKLPQGLSMAQVAYDLGRDRLYGTAAPGLTGADEVAVVRSALGILAELDRGAFTFDDGRLVFEGEAATSEIRARALARLRGLPDIYDVETSDLRLAPPPATRLAVYADRPAELSGAVPARLDLEETARTLGVSEVRLGTDVTRLNGVNRVPLQQQFAALGPFVDMIARGEITLAPQVDRLDLTLRPGVAVPQVNAALASAFGDAEISLQATEPAAPSVATSPAPATVSSASFPPDLRNCAVRAQQILSSGRIRFVAGSADLASSSFGAIDQVAAVARRCVIDGGLVAEIGGHTDAHGSSIENYQLSYARARAVAQALEARGVPGRGLRSIGHGSNKPIAGNDTSEGRAANRRTTILWTNLAQ